jgi:hypothetical protein
MISDLTLDDDDSAPERRAAFMIAPAATQAEMLLIERMHREGGHPEYAGAGVVIFEDEEGELEPENAALWRRLMKWPRLPTSAEAMAWKLNAEARQAVRFWDELQAARSASP